LSAVRYQEIGRYNVGNLLALISSSFVPQDLTALEARKSAIESEINKLAIAAFLGEAKAVRTVIRLNWQLEDVNAEIDRLTAASRSAISASSH
jgi:hypothetical protein